MAGEGDDAVVNPNPIATDTLELAVVMDFEGDASPGALAEMRREIETLLEPCGLSLLWRVRGGAGLPGIQPWQPREVYERVAVASFKGACSPMSGRAREDDRTLGYTHVSDGEVIPFLSVDCDRIRGLVEPKAAACGLSQADLMLGRAMGRVLAHELFHVLARTQSHGRVGAAKATLSAQELIQPSLAFEPDDIERIRDGVFPQLPVAGAGASQATDTTP